MNIIIKEIYWYIFQISGERLQDHWSSGFLLDLHSYRLHVPGQLPGASCSKLHSLNVIIKTSTCQVNVNYVSKYIFFFFLLINCHIFSIKNNKLNVFVIFMFEILINRYLTIS